jgi:hypothetical protein
MSYALPSGWFVKGDAEVTKMLERMVMPKADAEGLRAFLDRGSVVFFVMGKRTYAKGEQLTVTLSIGPAAPEDKPPLRFMNRQVTNRSTHEAWLLLDKPAPITRSGVDGAEMTDRYILRTRDGITSTIRQTLRMFIRGDHAFLVTVMWDDARGDRPGEATAALDAISFYAPTP